MSSLNNSKIIIIGGAGFVGSNLARIILKNYKPEKLLIVDNLLSAEEENIPKNEVVAFEKGSITDNKILDKVTDTYDYIFHLATYHGNQSSIYDPLADHENNTLTTLKLMNHVKDFKNLKKLVYSSAGCSVAAKTFDSAVATTEEDPISIIQDSPYSMSKIFGEFYSVYFYRQHNVPTVRARFQNVYGPGEVLGAGKWRGTPATVWRNVTPTFIYKALTNEQLPVENEGIATRDFIYVDDICLGLIACALKGNAGDVYNLATGKESSILELATLINNLSGNKAGILKKPKRNWDNSGKRFGSPVKAKQQLDFEVKISLEEGLKRTIDWTKDNLTFIQKCMQKHNDQIAKYGQ